jgi:NADH-quinone oxidoreductase subunit M
MLTTLLFLPLLGALLLSLVPGSNERALRAVTLLVTGVVAVLGIWLFAGFDGAVAAAQHVTSGAWFSLPTGAGPAEVRFALGIDGLSILLVTLTAVLMPLVVLSTSGAVKQRVKEFLIWLLVMETGMLGVFLSLDLVLFYVFWEASLVPLYFLVGIWGGERRLYATIKFFLYTFGGSLLMLLAVIAMIYRFQTSSIVELTELASALPLAAQGWLFAGFALAFAIKVPLLPFHTWLPDAHTEAPTAGSVILAGVLLKMGTYGLIRFGVAMFPAAAVEAAPWFMALGAVGIVYGALLAMAQTDIKRLIACSSVSHLGFVVLGTFALTHAGMAGSVLQMINHGLSTGLLFLLVGMIYERRHTRAIDQFGGVAAVMPIFAVFFTIAVLSSVGLPGLNGFVGEYLILLGAFQTSPTLAAVGVSGVVLGAVYLLSATRRILYGPITREENRALTDLNAREIGLMLPIVVLVVWIGVAPNLFLDRTRGTLEALVERAQAVRGEALVRAGAPAPPLPGADLASDRPLPLVPR